MQPDTEAAAPQAGSYGTTSLLVEGDAPGLNRLLWERLRSAAEPPTELEARLRFCQRMSDVGQVACGVAHDLNNLLTVVVGLSALDLHSLAAHDPRRDSAERIQRVATQAAALARRLLDLGRPPADPRPVHLNTLLLEMEKVLRSLLPPAVALVLRLDPALGLAEAEPGRLEQVVVNLVLNARDAMPQGGRVTLTTAGCLVGPGRLVPGLAPGEYLTLAVSDTGCGMDKATLARVFEPFFTTKPAGRGTGLGLATAAEVVEQCRGRIQVQSEPGRGTTFTLYLPRMPEAPPPRPRTEPAMGQPSPPPETVLVAEDHEGVRNLVSQVLGRAGYTVLVALNGPEALDLYRQHAAEVVLLIADLVLPLMNGRELADAVLRLRPDVRVLFMSGYPAGEALPGELPADAGFLQKPFKPEDLLRQVRAALGGPDG
jgi:signal transduction histidine kinase/CheY-like chemotaxis protein